MWLDLSTGAVELNAAKRSSSFSGDGLEMLPLGMAANGLLMSFDKLTPSLCCEPGYVGGDTPPTGVELFEKFVDKDVC